MDLHMFFNMMKVWLILSIKNILHHALYVTNVCCIVFSKRVIFSDGNAIEVITYDVLNNVTTIKFGHGYLWRGL